MEENCTDGGSKQKKLNSESIMNAIIGMFVATLNEINGIG